jgi:hypothetical protein
MGAGKVVTLIGAIVGLASIALSFVLPAFFGWYRIEGSYGGTVVIGAYFTGLGTLATTGGMPPIGGIAIFQLIGGAVLIVGAILCIVGASKEKKALGIVGGILILAGPMFLIMDLLVLSSADFAAMILGLGGPPGASPLWGSFVPAPGALLSWGIWIGTFIAFAGGALGLIGGITS